MGGLEANRSLLVTDVASIKRPVIDRVTRAMAAAAAHRYLAGHPLAGAERYGWSSARPGLLDQTVWAICPVDLAGPAQALGTFARLFDLFDARLIVCEAEAHDRAVARTSHGPHVLAEVLAATLNGRTPALTAALSGGAFRDMTRIARSDFRLWREILEENRDAVEEALLEWGRRLIALARSEKRAADLEALWREGTGGRELVDRVRWDPPPAWRNGTAPLPPWRHLLELGERGMAIRRPRIVGSTLRYERTAETVSVATGA
jgi:prephenate dehydrogenase